MPEEAPARQAIWAVALAVLLLVSLAVALTWNYVISPATGARHLTFYGALALTAVARLIR